MKFDVVTIFPRMFDAPLAEGVVARGVEAGVIDLRVHDLRDFTTDRHRVVDDVPYGGGPGMVMKPEPFFRAADHIRTTRGQPGAILLTSPQGRRLTHAEAARLAGLGHVAILCGRYEGIDDRVRQHVATDEISIGDYVLSGGELAALVIVDVVSRLVPGVVGDARSVEADSFMRGLLDYPHYTRPAEFQGWPVPEVLLSGHHAEIARWRAREAVRRTMALRPELLAGATLEAEERAAYEQAVRERQGADHERD
jgi:tRNA (guanine37-N1)-methyltransferase